MLWMVHRQQMLVTFGLNKTALFNTLPGWTFQVKLGMIDSEEDNIVMRMVPSVLFLVTDERPS